MSGSDRADLATVVEAMLGSAPSMMAREVLNTVRRNGKLLTVDLRYEWIKHWAPAEWEGVSIYDGQERIIVSVGDVL